ncbi:MAG: deoxyribodipyrimidine photo-lyase [Candidatus Marinimicrobia bacterium]|nr:deoxyribodipyrimidine photo-lyase [Candidatus Neomarinimicrobiota bacterium]
MTYSKSIFLFRRDLRLQDNRGLNQALQESEEVIPVFNFDPRQTAKHNYFSKPGFQFLRASLLDLDQHLNDHASGIHILEGLSHASVLAYAQASHAQAVYVNRDYTPFSFERDRQLQVSLAAKGIDFHSVDDALLLPPEFGTKHDGTPYTVFTPFFRHASTLPPLPVQGLPDHGRFAAEQVDSKVLNLLERRNTENEVTPGRRGAVAILESLASLGTYDLTRDIPSLAGTSRLSVHLKFGTCSVREVYYQVADTLGFNHSLIRQLYWRDFYTHIAFYFPSVFGHAFKQKYDLIPWRTNAEDFQRWKEGTTGYPIVDAGMRELLATGFMHNRVRMIVASFLTKQLLIDWKMGERFFAQHLLDYDPCVNNGNWQWSASTGCDAQPYFRIFNPWIQQKKFDPQAVYIKKWVPELAAIPSKQIHRLSDDAASGYPRPLIDHQLARHRALEVFKAC